MTQNNDSRYPFQYSASFIREYAFIDAGCIDVPHLSGAIARALGISKEEFCKKMADQYLKERANDTEQRQPRGV